MLTYLIGYGTLLYRQSLGDTIGQAAARQKTVLPVTVPGYRRLFNLRPEHYQPSHVVGGGAEEAAAMNIEAAPSEVSFNGLAFPVSLSELEALDKRERYYERRAVTMLAFDSGEALGEGHAYVAPDDSAWITRDPSQLLPLWRDITWARAGAYRIGEAFGRAYDTSTYLADGRTLVADFYASRLATPPAEPEEEKG